MFHMARNEPRKALTKDGSNIKEASRSIEAGRRYQFKFMHGMRAISIYWVVFAHIYLGHPFLELEDKVSPILSLDRSSRLVRHLSTHLVMNAGFAVATFFVISGALSVHTILPLFRRRSMSFIIYILLRWLRFAPPTVGMICFVVLWPKLFGSGPLFHEQLVGYVWEPCFEYWWTNLLFITNHMPKDKMVSLNIHFQEGAQERKRNH